MGFSELANQGFSQRRNHQSNQKRNQVTLRDRKESKNNSPQHSRTKSIKDPKSLAKPLTVTRKQLNPKYNYIDLESLQKEKS